jgi:NAD(P)-dependent dehydrogenase (short-subunit alcohol dehydrogenase family)
MSKSSLQDKVAIITGGSKGIGLGIAKAYAKEGVAVTITGRNQAALDSAKRDIETEVPNARVLAVVADNKEHSSADRIVSQTISQFNRLDILVNNAQEFYTMIPFEDYTWEQFSATYETGVFATWRLMKASLKYLKETEGVIINMGSGAGTNAVPLHAAYGSNKEAIRGLSRIAAKEFSPFGVTVNVICPFTDSAEYQKYSKSNPEMTAEILKAIPLGHVGDAELNVGGLCVFLSKPEGKYITGSTFDVDGGGSIRP